MHRKTAVSPPAVILVDDEPEILFSFSVMLRRAGIREVIALQDSRELLPQLLQREVGAVVLDLQMPHVTGAELLREIAASHPQIPVIMVTAAGQLDTAVDCMKAGAFDYFAKPVSPERLVSGIQDALEIYALRRQMGVPDQEAPVEAQSDAFSRFTTRSAKMRQLFGYLQGVAPSDQPVLILGETGVGKELVAGALHELSGRSGPFVALNSAGLDDQVFADTLFGHRKGSFTGADALREGLVAKAAGGTLFLDEIGDLAPASQVKLLRLLQEGEYYQLGSDQPSFSAARVIAATNCGLAGLVAAGTFRKDLYFRLCSHQVHIPPLRERPEDVAPLLEEFLRQASAGLNKKTPTYPPELLGYLAGYHFPGNVRELRAMAYDSVARHKGGVLSLAAFREAMEHARAQVDRDLPQEAPFGTLKEMEQRLVEQALVRSGGNQGAAATMLGITRQALNKRLKRR